MRDSGYPDTHQPARPPGPPPPARIRPHARRTDAAPRQPARGGAERLSLVRGPGAARLAERPAPVDPSAAPTQASIGARSSLLGREPRSLSSGQPCAPPTARGMCRPTCCRRRGATSPRLRSRRSPGASPTTTLWTTRSHDPTPAPRDHHRARAPGSPFPARTEPTDHHRIPRGRRQSHPRGHRRQLRLHPPGRAGGPVRPSAERLAPASRRRSTGSSRR